MECKSIPSVGVSQNLVLRNFGVELLRALFLLLALTQPAYGVWDRFFAIDAVRPVCCHSRTFAAKDFLFFCRFFAQKWIDLSRQISTCSLNCEQPGRLTADQSTALPSN